MIEGVEMNLSQEVSKVVTLAFEMAKNKKNEYLTPEHLLYVILISNNEVITIINDLDADIEELKLNLNEYIEKNLEKVKNKEPVESIGFKQIFYMAMQMVMSSGKKEIGTDHILAAIYELEESFAAYYLEDAGISKRELLYHLCHMNDSDMESIKEFEDEFDGDEEEFSDSKNTSLILKYSQDLNELVEEANYDPLIGREDILDKTIQILCRRTKNNPIHVGESGVGKTALTLGLAKLINENKVPKKLLNAKIYSLDIGSLLAGTKYRGDFEERIKKVLDEAKKLENSIVYIDEIHNIVGAGALGTGALDASNLLKPYLNEGKIRFIGATTYDEYKKHFEKDKALARRFQKIEVKETSIDETINILERLKGSFEEFHQVLFTKEAINAAVRLSDKYMNDRYLPDKAIDIIDEAGAYIAIKNDERSNVIDEIVIEEIIAKTCNIPKQTVLSDEKDVLLDLEDKLKSAIFGQNKAIDEIVRAIKLSRAGLNDDDKPIASMLFVGPTGVGKTEIARTLAKIMGIELIRFDMSEYVEKHAAAKLIGAPPGYVGYEEGGLLTDAIRKKPHAVLLLDEIEKAHVDIMNVLLQVMDYASLTDNQGRKADFRNIIIIMTSNAGARNIGKVLIGFNEREIKGEAITDEVKKVFSPEFRNRLDKIVVFNHIDEKMAIDIVKKELSLFKKKLEKKNVFVKFEDELINYIAKCGISKEFGAREIKRVIDSKIKPLLVDKILFEDLKNGGTCSINVNDDKIYLTII